MMNKKCLALFGLKATGKTTFCNFLKSKYNASIIYLSRMLEKKVCKLTNGNQIYYELKFKLNNRIPLMNYLKNEIKEIIDNSNFIVIEGMLCEEDCKWFKENFGIECLRIYIENNDNELRFKRYSKRNNYSIETAKEKLQESDRLRISSFINSGIDVIIKNDTSMKDFENKIDLVMAKLFSKKAENNGDDKSIVRHQYKLNFQKSNLVI